MKRQFAVLALVLMFFLASCAEEGEVSLEVVNQDVIIYNQIESTYNHQKVLGLINQNVDMFTFYKLLNISQYKTMSDAFYTVIQTTSGYYVVLFDGDGLNATLLQIHFSPLTSQEQVDNLRVGMTLNDARKADPNGQYEFLLHSWSEYPRISYHYFASGYCYCIEYIDDTISNIIRFTI